MANVEAYLTGGEDYSSPFFSGDVPVADFSLLAIVQNGIACFRLTYTIPPLQLDVTGPTDALNPDNYEVEGSRPNLVSSVVSVKGDPNSVDIYLTKPLTEGDWLLKVVNVVAA